jgi:hypothetical protein
MARTQTLHPKLTIVRYCSILSARLRVAVLYSVLFSLFAFTARPEQTAVCRQTHAQQQVRVSSCCYLLSKLTAISLAYPYYGVLQCQLHKTTGEWLLLIICLPAVTLR